MLKIKVEGLDAARGLMQGLSSRRLNAALATALTRTAVSARQEIRAALPSIFDRPTPYTLNSLFVQPATAQRLEARVWFKDQADARGGTPATKYLLPQVQGGARGDKRFERALRANGQLPGGWKTVPAPGGRRDAWGNLSRAHVLEILTQLRAGSSVRKAGKDVQRKQLAAQRRAGGQYFVVLPGARVKLKAGIYQRELLGRNITPVVWYVQEPRYRQRFNFDALAERATREELPRQFARAIDEHLARVAAKRSA